MRTTFRTLWIALSIAFVSACSETPEEQSAAKTIRATIGSGAKIALGSRTALEEDGFSIRWATDDKIALWAIDGSGNATLAAHTFTMYHYNATYGNAKFTADIPEMPAGEYTYCAVSPAPAAANVNGTQASFDIPATQNGTFDGRYDIMVAAADQTAGALEEGDNSERVNLQFVHKVHLLQIAIPANKMGTPITSLELTFPTAVTGRLTVDAANPEADPVLSGGSNVLTLNFDEPKDAGDIVYAMIAPTTIADTENISIKAYASGLTSVPVNMFKEGFTGRKFAAGHATPINLTVPELYKFTQLIFSVGANNLGEAPQTITLTVSSGRFPDGSTSKTITTNSTNSYSIDYEGDYTDNISGKTITVTYDSEHARVSNTFVMPTVKSFQKTVVNPLTVPYLFFEDFSTIHTAFEFDDAKVSSLMSADGHLLNDYITTQGWNGAHIKGVVGQSVRVNVRHQSTMGATRSNGRLDTPAMTALKSAAKLRVTFDMGAYVNSGYGSNNDVFCIAGTHTQSTSSAINGVVNTRAFGNVSADTSRIPPQFSTVTLTTGTIPASFNDNSFGATFPTYSFTANNCTSATRFGWIPCCSQSTWATSNNAHYYLYIDNIKVSIAQ